MAVGVRSTELPVTTLIESCQSPATYEDLVLPPELHGERVTSTAKLRTPGRELALRAFGLGGRSRIRVSPLRVEDQYGAAQAPEGNPYGGPAGGEVLFRSLEAPDRLLTTQCPAAPIPLGDDVWNVHVSAPHASLPADGGTVLFQSARPFRVLGSETRGVSSTWDCTDHCGLGVTCPASGIRNIFSFSLEKAPGEQGTRFSAELIIDH